MRPHERVRVLRICYKLHRNLVSRSTPIVSHELIIYLLSAMNISKRACFRSVLPKSCTDVLADEQAAQSLPVPSPLPCCFGAQGAGEV
jgi:hypothetical protein